MFFSTAYAQDAAVAGPSPIASLIPFLLMGLVFYFLLIRPQQQQRKRHLEMVSSIKRGDQVVTAGGLLGKVVRAGDGPEVTVEIAEGVQVTVVRATITDVRGRDGVSKMAPPARGAKPAKPGKPANDAPTKPQTKTKA